MIRYQDIKPGLSIYCSREVKKTRNPNGTWHREYAGEIWYQMGDGKIKRKDWILLAEQAVRDNKDSLLLKAIEAYVYEHCIWLRKEDVRCYSLRCLVDGAYKAWEKKGWFFVPLSA